MIIDCHTWGDSVNCRDHPRYHVYVDERRVPMVWYVDTEQGFVKTYRIGDQGPINPRGFDRMIYPFDWELEYSDPEMPVSRILRGQIRLEPWREPAD
jgi:hypothetical protein